MIVRYYYLYNNLPFSCTFTPSAKRVKKTKAFIAPDLAAIFVFLPPGRLGWTRVHRNHERKLEGENARRQEGYTTLPFFSFILFFFFFPLPPFPFCVYQPTNTRSSHRLRRSGRVHNVWVTRKPVISSRTAAFLLWHRSGGVSIIQRGNSARRTSTTAIAAATAVSVYHHLHHHRRLHSFDVPSFPLSFRYAACWPTRSQVERTTSATPRHSSTLLVRNPSVLHEPR